MVVVLPNCAGGVLWRSVFGLKSGCCDRTHALHVPRFRCLIVIGNLHTVTVALSHFQSGESVYRLRWLLFTFLIYLRDN